MRIIKTQQYKLVEAAHYGTQPGFKEREDYEDMPSNVLDAPSDETSTDSVKEIWKKKKKKKKIKQRNESKPNKLML